MEQLFSVADRLEKKVEAASERLEQSSRAILSKAFRGELAEQDPNDDPASVLLERINREKEG